MGRTLSPVYFMRCQLVEHLPKSIFSDVYAWNSDPSLSYEMSMDRTPTQFYLMKCLWVEHYPQSILCDIYV
jgi:hypothetical protein